MDTSSPTPQPWRAPGCTCPVEAAGTRREVRILDRSCPVHAERAGEPLATWAAPSWATRSRVEDGMAWHTRTGATCTALGDQDEPTDVTPELSQADGIDVDTRGRITVAREGEPVVVMDGARYSLDQAEVLAGALAELIDAARGGAR